MKSCHTPVSQTMDSKPSGEFLHELEEKMQVAGIQLQLLETIRRSGDHNRSAEAIASLNSDLYNVTRLYEIAENFKLPEIQLAIVSAANHYDPALIEMFWQKIFEKEFQDANHLSPETFVVIIGNKLESFGKVYASSEKYFPLSFIVSYLESRTQTRHLNPPEWLAQILLDLGFSLTTLVETYHRIYKSRSSSSSWPGKELQLLNIIIFLFKQFNVNMNAVPRAERRAFATKSLDLISAYVLDLQSLSTTNQTARTFVNELRALQQALEQT